MDGHAPRVAATRRTPRNGHDGRDGARLARMAWGSVQKFVDIPVFGFLDALVEARWRPSARTGSAEDQDVLGACLHIFSRLCVEQINCQAAAQDLAEAADAFDVAEHGSTMCFRAAYKTRPVAVRTLFAIAACGSSLTRARASVDGDDVCPFKRGLRGGKHFRRYDDGDVARDGERAIQPQWDVLPHVDVPFIEKHPQVTPCRWAVESVGLNVFTEFSYPVLVRSVVTEEDIDDFLLRAQDSTWPEPVLPCQMLVHPNCTLSSKPSSFKPERASSALAWPCSPSAGTSKVTRSFKPGFTAKRLRTFV